MNAQKKLMVSGILILAGLAMLALVVGMTRAQAPGPETEINERSIAETEVLAAVPNVIPIQGSLSDATGNPINGTRIITFSLYTSSVATDPLCQDDDSVQIVNGLFSAEVDHCSSLDIDGKALYLGIQAEGDAEMSPRQAIYPVPYAYTLKPGAIISSSTSNALLHVENWHASGRGLRAYAMSETGVNYGIVGASRSPDGYGGYYYNNGGGTALYAEATTETGDIYGVHGKSESNVGRGVYGEGSNPAGGVGIEGTSTVGSGVYGNSTEGYGLYGNTGAASHNYGLYTQDNIYSLNYNLMGASMQVVQNNGEKSLEPGDVVAFSGIGSPLAANGQPVVQVVAAEEANSTAVAGVVYSRFNIETVNAEPQKIPNEVTPQGAAEPGEYLLVVIQGPAQVKVSALGGDIQPGDLLSSAELNGYAGKAAEVTFGEVKSAMPGTVLGKALEALDKGEALLYVFVTLQ